MIVSIPTLAGVSIVICKTYVISAGDFRGPEGCQTGY